MEIQKHPRSERRFTEPRHQEAEKQLRSLLRSLPRSNLSSQLPAGARVRLTSATQDATQGPGSLPAFLPAPPTSHSPDILPASSRGHASDAAANVLSADSTVSGGKSTSFSHTDSV